MNVCSRHTMTLMRSELISIGMHVSDIAGLSEQNNQRWHDIPYRVERGDPSSVFAADARLVPRQQHCGCPGATGGDNEDRDAAAEESAKSASHSDVILLTNGRVKTVAHLARVQ